MDRSCDATIAVLTDPQLIVKRTAARGHVGREQRAARQLDAGEKAARATYVVRNDGDLAQLRAQLAEVLSKLDP